MLRQLDRQREERREPAMLGQLASRHGVLRGVVAEHGGAAAQIPGAGVKVPEPAADRQHQRGDEARGEE